MAFHDFDSAYYQRLRDEDPETERHFVSYFAPLLLAKLRRRLRSPALIEEVRQETFLRSFRAIRSGDVLKRPEQLGPFVHGICENTIREYLRADSRTDPMPQDPDSRPGDSVSPESELITSERKAMVRDTLERLSPRDRKLLRAVFWEERDKDEVCRELGVNRGHLRVLLHRAKIQFRAILQQKDASAI
jgi:RNA polymerase sigma-70 factor (ECF subfamily)